MRPLLVVVLGLAGFGPGLTVAWGQVGDTARAGAAAVSGASGAGASVVGASGARASGAAWVRARASGAGRARARAAAHSGMERDDVVVLARPEVVVRSSWARVMVVDARPDTTRIGTDRDGRRIRFNTSASMAIAHHLQAAVGAGVERDRTILIVIQKLNISYLPEEERNLDFLAEIYEQKTDTGWLKISTYHRTRRIDHSIASGIGTLLSSVMGAIDVGLTVTRGDLPLVFRAEGRPGLVDPDPYMAVEAPRMVERRDGGEAGYYRRFDGFRLDSLVPCSYGLHRLDDSSYTLMLPMKAAGNILDSIWVFADTAGCLYFHLLGNRFVLLRSEGNSYCFHIPQSMPDMYSIEQIKNQWQRFNPESWYPQPSSDLGSNNLLAIPVMLAMYCAVDLGIYGIAYSITKAKVRKIQRSGKRSENFRDCRLNMENGEVEY